VPANADRVLDETAAAFATAQPEPHMPYWATPWASGLALAEVALQRREQLAGRKALELGCGLGLTACAAQEVGAELTVSDCFGEALLYCQYNVLRNTGRVPFRLLADWRLEGGRARLFGNPTGVGRYEVVLAADVLYEPEDVAPLLELAPRLVRPGGQFWLAEPGRATSQRFVVRARALGWSEERVVMEREWPLGAGHARVTVHSYRF
jgi:predicted nicotinamide N-methyase